MTSSTLSKTSDAIYLSDIRQDGDKQTTLNQLNQQKASQLGLERKSEEISLLKQKKKNRDRIWVFTKWFLIITTIFILGVVMMHGFGIWGFKMDRLVLVSLTSGMVANTIGVLHVVASQVFRD